MDEMREEIHRHMDVTEDLTNKARGSNKSFLSAANGKSVLFNGNRCWTELSASLFCNQKLMEKHHAGASTAT